MLTCERWRAANPASRMPHSTHLPTAWSIYRKSDCCSKWHGQSNESKASEADIVVRRASSRVGTLFIIYHSHTTDCRCHCGHRPCPQPTQLNPPFRLKANTPAALLAKLYWRSEQTVRRSEWIILNGQSNRHTRNLSLSPIVLVPDRSTSLLAGSLRRDVLVPLIRSNLLCFLDWWWCIQANDEVERALWCLSLIHI